MLGNYFKPLVNRVIDTEQDDFRKVVLLQLAIFMIISVLMILKPLGTSLMLSAYGIDIIPIAFVGIAVAAIFIHFGLMLLRRSFTLNQAIIINFSFNILIILGIAAAIYSNILNGWTTVAVYIYISLFSVITVTLFFQYCQSLLSIRDAKRVLSYVGVGAIAGGVFGGYFASATVSYFGNIGLLFSAIAFLTVAALSLRKVHQEYGTDAIDDSIESEWMGGQFLRILKNRHVIYLIGIIFFGVITSKLLDYLFNAVASSHFDDSEALTAFFGFWFSSINVIGLLIQLFLVNPLIDRLGVTYSMSIMPILISASLVAFIYMPILAFGIVMKLVDGSMKQSLYKTSTEINIMPLSTPIRERAKSLIDVVVDSIATGLSGVLIYVLINRVSLPLQVITMTTIIVVMAWLLFIMLSRKTYLSQLANLVSYSDDQEDEEIDVTPKEYIEHLLKDLGRKSVKRFNRLTKFTKEAESAIKSAAIEIIGEEYKRKGLSTLGHLRTDDSFLVRKKYFEEKLKYINTSVELDNLYSFLKPNNKVILTGALARAIGHRPGQLEKYHAYERINEAYTYLTQNDVPKKLWRTWMTAIGHSRYEKYYPIIKENLQQPTHNDMKMYALFAVRRGKLSIFFPEVIQCKVKAAHRKRWHKVIATFPKKLLTHLNALPLTSNKELKRLIPAIKYIEKQSHLNFLFKTLNHPKRGVRIEALKAIGFMKLNYPYLNYNRRKNRARLNKNMEHTKKILEEIRLLNDKKKRNIITDRSIASNNALVLLKNELHENMHVLFVLLGLVIDSEDMMKCYYGLIRGNRQASLDYLDQLLPYHLKIRLLPLLKMITSNEIKKSILADQRFYK